MAEQVTTAQQGFVDPYTYTTPGKQSMNLADQFADIFTGGSVRNSVDRNKALYEQMVERSKTNSARAWEEYFDSTAVQRRVKDIEKAGLNPWLALQSGGINSNGSSSVSNQSASAKSTKDADPDSLLRLMTTALLLFKILL